MKSVLEEFYKGELRPFEWRVLYGPAFHQLNREFEREKTKFAAGLPEDKIRQFKALEAMRKELEGMIEMESFRHNFRLGVQLMAEVSGVSDDAP